MKVVILSGADVAGPIAAALMDRGHEVAFFDGAVHGAALEALGGYDGCLLLGHAPGSAAVARAFRSRGKAVWREWAAIPPDPATATP